MRHPYATATLARTGPSRRWVEPAPPTYGATLERVFLPDVSALEDGRPARWLAAAGIADQVDGEGDR